MISCPPPVEPIKPPAIVQYSKNPKLVRPRLQLAKRAEVKVLCSTLSEPMEKPPTGGSYQEGNILALDNPQGIPPLIQSVTLNEPVTVASILVDTNIVVPTSVSFPKFPLIPETPPIINYVCLPVVKEPATVLMLLLGLVIFTYYKRHVLYQR